jgi:RNA polymerase sigma-70 factor (ECF subfamily)
MGVIDRRSGAQKPYAADGTNGSTVDTRGILQVFIGRALIWQTAMQITELLQRIHAGDQQALNTVIPLVYDELKKLAAGHLRREGRARPLDTTALVHEAFLRLARGQHPSYQNRTHFYGIASRLMRQVLVDLARARSRQKRSAMQEVQLAGTAELGRRPDESMLVMDDALERLSHIDPVKVQLIEMRYFGGMTVEESATALSLSVSVIRRELRLAQAWLHKEMAG